MLRGSATQKYFYRTWYTAQVVIARQPIFQSLDSAVLASYFFFIGMGQEWLSKNSAIGYSLCSLVPNRKRAAKKM